jgi:hypothetical protein
MGRLGLGFIIVSLGVQMVHRKNIRTSLEASGSFWKSMFLMFVCLWVFE